MDLRVTAWALSPRTASAYRIHLLKLLRCFELAVYLTFFPQCVLLPPRPRATLGGLVDARDDMGRRALPPWSSINLQGELQDGRRGQIGRHAPAPPSMAKCDSSCLISPSEMKSESGFLLNLFHCDLQFFLIHYSCLYLYAGICPDLPNTQSIFTVGKLF